VPRPFPGIDPYLEAQDLWPDFHATFINYWREAIAERLPDHYEVRIDERVNLAALPAEKIKRIRPDLSISQRAPSSPSSPASAIVTLEPVSIPLVIEEETRETYIEILQRPDRTLVAVLELLSPPNKEEPGRSDYLARRNAILNHAVHLVELDFLMGGRRLPLAQDYPPGDYFALVARSHRRPNCDVYSWSLTQEIPGIPIPLRAPDPDLLIDWARSSPLPTNADATRVPSTIRSIPLSRCPKTSWRGFAVRWRRKDNRSSARLWPTNRPHMHTSTTWTITTVPTATADTAVAHEKKGRHFSVRHIGREGRPG
jgi:hypothetical protein